MKNSSCEKKIYLLMNKPAGYVCSAVSDSHKTVFQLLPPEIQVLQSAKRGCRLHTVGRLDCDTTGLLLFTTDGDFSHKLTAPECHVKKVYRVELVHPVDKETQEKYNALFKVGVTLPAEKKAPEQQSGPAEIQFISPKECLVTLAEGKFHQVRRMFLAVGNQVAVLKRIKMGCYELPEDLTPGSFVII